jgi:hypothetical protein
MADEGPELYRNLMSIRPDGLSDNAWLGRAGVHRNFIQSIKNGKRPRTDLLEKMIVAAGWTPAQFFDLLGGQKAPLPDDGTPKAGLPFQRRNEPHDVPLLGTAQGSDFEVEEGGKIKFIERMDLDFENVVDTVRRPAALAGRTEVYAITVVGNSMADKFEDGDPAYVDPKRQARPGDYVVVQLVRRDADGEGRIVTALLKQLVKRTSAVVELRQRNPEVVFTIPASEVAHVHRVIPWREIVFF